MSVTRVLLTNAGITYRFIELNARPDGSLVLLIDRDPSALDAMNPGLFPQAKYTVHTTGAVNYYPHRKRRTQTHQLMEPLTDLTQFHPFAVYSIPSLTRLDVLNDAEASDRFIALTGYELGRMTFYFEIGPNIKPARLEGAVAQIHYEIYSLLMRVGPPPDLARQRPDHFVTAAYKNFSNTLRPAPILNPAEAEIRFTQKAGKDKLSWNANDIYTVLADVVMRVPPALTVEFDRPDLSVEVIPFEHGQPSHKVRFHIRDRGGKVKRKDLRCHIVSITLNAEI